MAVSDYNTTPSSNTAINGVSVAEGCAPAGLNNAIRQMMADLATLYGTTLPAAYQPLAANLTAFAALSGAADRLGYFTGSGAMAVAALTSFARTILDDADAATARATLGLDVMSTKANVTTVEIAAGTLVTEAEGIAANDNDTTLPTAAAVKDYADTRVAAYSIGVGQTWQDVSGSRAHTTSYQNTTGRPIMVYISCGSGGQEAQVSSDNATWVQVGLLGYGSNLNATFIVPASWYYRISGTAAVAEWSELR